MKPYRRAGFSLIELLIITAILGIIIAVAVPNLQSAVGRANDTAVKGYIFHVFNGIEAARNRKTYALPPTESCAVLTNISADPKSVTSCAYTADFEHDKYKVTTVSFTGRTFQYSGSEFTLIE